MRKTFALIFLSALLLQSNAQTLQTSKDSINIFYDSLLTILKSDYLFKNEVNWDLVASETKSNLNQYNDFARSLSQINVLFNKLKAKHCQLFYKDTIFTATISQPDEKDFSEQWMKKYIANPSFEVKVLENKYGYILMPSINFEDISSGNIHKIAQGMYDQISLVKIKYNLKGWILDLRFNTGGNIYPMLLALYDFLGDNTIWGGLDINKKLAHSIKLSKGNYIDNNETISFIIPKSKKLDKSKVAIITSIVTASSGEIVALSFKARKNTCFIGQTTNGMTTSNDKKLLPFGTYMALTTGYDCDRNGNYYEKIKPETLLYKQDNFDTLLKDKNIIQAIKWIIKK